MTSTSKNYSIKYVILHAKPKRAPGWWPRDVDGKPCWVCVAPDGMGFSTVFSKRSKVRSRDAAEIREAFEDTQDRAFEWKAEAI